MKTLRYSNYPTEGFGRKNGKPYIIDEWGKIYDFSQEYDPVLKESYWSIDLPVAYIVTGKSPAAIIEAVNRDYNAQDVPADYRTLRILPWDGE